MRKTWRRFLRFRLRTLLFVVVLTALLFNWIRLAHRQHDIVCALEETHGDSSYDVFTSVAYDWELDEEGKASYAEVPRWQRWLGMDQREGCLGPDYFHSVVKVELANPEEKMPLLAELPKLRWLHISGSFSDGSLAHLRKLPRLRGLTINSYAEQDQLVSESSALQSKARVGTVTDAGIAHLADLADLEKLDLHLSLGCTQHSINCLKNLSKLRELCLVVEIGATACDGFGALGQLPQLRRLIIDAQGDVEFTGIECLRGLEELVIRHGTELSNDHLRRLADIAPLKRVMLIDCPHVTLEALAGMQMLELLQIHGCPKVVPAQMQFLAALPRLWRLHLQSNDGWSIDEADFWRNHESLYSGDVPIPAIAPPGMQFPNLRQVSLRDCGLIRMTDFRGMERLEDLSIVDCRELIADDIAGEVQLTGLKTLYLNDIAVGIAEIDPDWFRAWAGVQELDLFDYVPAVVYENLYRFPNLQRLTLTCTLKDVDEMLAHVGRANTLRALKVEHSERFTGAGLLHLSALPQLEELEFWGCNKLNGDGLANVSRLPHLKALNIGACDLAAYSQIANVPELETLRINHGAPPPWKGRFSSKRRESGGREFAGCVGNRRWRDRADERRSGMR